MPPVPVNPPVELVADAPPLELVDGAPLLEAIVPPPPEPLDEPLSCVLVVPVLLAEEQAAKATKDQTTARVTTRNLGMMSSTLTGPISANPIATRVQGVWRFPRRFIARSGRCGRIGLVGSVRDALTMTMSGLP
jgi:hypothetical protein